MMMMMMMMTTIMSYYPYCSHYVYYHCSSNLTSRHFLFPKQQTGHVIAFPLCAAILLLRHKSLLNVSMGCKLCTVHIAYSCVRAKVPSSVRVPVGTQEAEFFQPWPFIYKPTSSHVACLLSVPLHPSPPPPPPPTHTHPPSFAGGCCLPPSQYMQGALCTMLFF